MTVWSAIRANEDMAGVEGWRICVGHWHLDFGVGFVASPGETPVVTHEVITETPCQRDWECNAAGQSPHTGRRDHDLRRG
jgi:hypothetical protein